MKTLLGRTTTTTTAAAFIFAAGVSIPVRAQDWTWSGDKSPDWSEPLNWTNGVSGAHPDPSVDFTDSVSPISIRIGMGTHLPNNQNIDGLNLHDLHIGSLTNSLVIGGKPIRIHNTITHPQSTTVNVNTSEIVFSNDIAFAGVTPAPNVTFQRPAHFYGAVTEFNGSRYFRGSGWGGAIHFHGTAELTGGFFHDAGIQIYRMEPVWKTMKTMSPISSPAGSPSTPRPASPNTNTISRLKSACWAGSA